MIKWVQHAQNYIVSRLADHQQWQAAYRFCDHERIKQFMLHWPIDNLDDRKRSLSLIQQLAVQNQRVSSLMIHFLLEVDSFLTLETPEQPATQPYEQRLAAVIELAEQMVQHKQLAPSAAILYTLAGLASRFLAQSDNALQHYNQAVKLKRQLTLNDKLRYGEDFAIALTACGDLLIDMGDVDKALPILTEALSTYQQLPASNSPTHRLSLVKTLNTMAKLHSLNNDFDQSKNRFEQALHCYPPTKLLLPDSESASKAMTLRNLGLLHADHDKIHDAINLLQHAITIYQPLATHQPEIYLLELAECYYNISILLDDHQAATTAYTTLKMGCAVFVQLSKENPNNFQAELAEMQYRFGDILSRHHQLAPACQHFEQSIEITRKLAATDPVTHLPDLAERLNRYGAVLNKTFTFDTANTVLQEALSITRHLAINNPTDYAPEVAAILQNLAELFDQQRNFSAAFIASEEAIALLTNHQQHHPDWDQSDLGATLLHYASLLFAVGDLSKSAVFNKKALIIYRRLAVEMPAVHRDNLAAALNNVATLFRQMDESLGALSAYQEALTIYRQLASQDPKIYLPNLALTLNNIANQFGDNNDIGQAKLAYREALQLYRQLNKTKEDTFSFELVATLGNLGALLAEQGEIEEAIRLCEEAVRLAETINRNNNPLHLAKSHADDAYHLLLTQATLAGDGVKAFALCSALRDGQSCSIAISRQQLQATQDWLSEQLVKYDKNICILVVNQAAQNQLVVGLISQNQCVFQLLAAEKWQQLLPSQDTSLDSAQRKTLAKDIWLALPAMIKNLFTTDEPHKLLVAISGDPLWSAFPWELLCFGESERDYIGLHHALPRVSTLQAHILAQQLSFNRLGSGEGHLAIFAPFDTGIQPLEGIIDEVSSIKQLVSNSGGQYRCDLGIEANDISLPQCLLSKPDIFYFSGHGTIIKGEELLVIHRHLCQENSTSNRRSKVTYFGKAELQQLSSQSTGLLFEHHPLIVLNSCVTGNIRGAGGAREDLVATMLALGAGAIIATALPIKNEISTTFAKVFFSHAQTNQIDDIASLVIKARRYLAENHCHNKTGSNWGAWGLIHIHGNAMAKLKH